MEPQDQSSVHRSEDSSRYLVALHLATVSLPRYGRKMQRVRDKTWLVSPMDAEYAMPHVFENTFGSIPYEMLIDPNSAESTPAKSVEVDDNGNPVDDKSSPPPAEPDDNGRDGVSWLIGSMLSGSALGAMVIYGYRKR